MINAICWCYLPCCYDWIDYGCVVVRRERQADTLRRAAKQATRELKEKMDNMVRCIVVEYLAEY